MNEKNQPLVSVIITTYQNEKYLPRAVRSVLRQTYPNIELIVVDDNPPKSSSRKNTEEVMSRFPEALYLKHRENRNGAAARNTGIRAASGKYLAFLDNDDVYFSGHVAACVAALEEHGECAGAVCGVVKVRGGICWDRVRPQEGDFVRALFFSERALGTGSNLFVRASCVREIGGFDESFRRHQDVEFGVRLYSLAPPRILDQVQIAKEMDGFSNMPDFEGFRAAKRHFMETFADRLGAMPQEDRNRYFAGQYSALLYSACATGDRENIRAAVLELKKYRQPDRKERLLIALTNVRLFGFYETLKRFAKTVKAPFLYREVREALPPGDRRVLKGMLKG